MESPPTTHWQSLLQHRSCFRPWVRQRRVKRNQCLLLLADRTWLVICVSQTSYTTSSQDFFVAIQPNVTLFPPTPLNINICSVKKLPILLFSWAGSQYKCPTNDQSCYFSVFIKGGQTVQSCTKAEKTNFSLHFPIVVTIFPFKDCTIEWTSERFVSIKPW